MPDKYDAAMDRLRSSPRFADAVKEAWFDPLQTENGCLFRFVHPPQFDPTPAPSPPGFSGCLSMIRGEFGNALDRDGNDNAELTQRIREDCRIPASICDVTSESLDAFAEWQRELDVYYGRV